MKGGVKGPSHSKCTTSQISKKTERIQDRRVKRPTRPFSIMGESVLCISGIVYKRWEQLREAVYPGVGRPARRE